MIGGEDRLLRAQELLEPLVRGASPKTVLDAGCGTGTDSIALARLGCSVIGVDSSPGMIAIARKRATENEVVVRFEIDDLLSLSTVTDASVDVIICRGNTVPHFNSIEDLKQAIRAMARVTKQDGILVLGWLNYIPVMKDQKRLVGLSGDSENAFLRFNDFNQDGSLNFNIVTMNFGTDTHKWILDWQTTRLEPWMADDVGMLLVANGWMELEIASSLDREEFSIDNSKDVFVFAVRG